MLSSSLVRGLVIVLLEDAGGAAAAPSATARLKRGAPSSKSPLPERSKTGRLGVGFCVLRLFAGVGCSTQSCWAKNLRIALHS